MLKSKRWTKREFLKFEPFVLVEGRKELGSGRLLSVIVRMSISSIRVGSISGVNHRGRVHTAMVSVGWVTRVVVLSTTNGEHDCHENQSELQNGKKAS